MARDPRGIRLLDGPGDPHGIAGRDRRPVAVLTGGGAGIGAAIAEELGRRGTFVVTVDPMVSVDGGEQLPDAAENTAERIIAAGGSAVASSASVTDAEGIATLFTELADEHGGLDAVVNAAGITRPTSFTRGSEKDWSDILSVHLDGYLNVLAAALPIMAEAGHGHVLGVTSGSGWRAADAGAYGCAKRAVAALTWQLGRAMPPGIVVNAISPIAMTRMVIAALSRRPVDSGPPTAGGAETSSRSSGATGGSSTAGSSTGGLSLGSMPAPADIGPLGAHLVADEFEACRARVLFTAGSEMAVVDEPRLMEAFPGGAATQTEHALAAITESALVPAELHQGSAGGTNARFAATLDGEGRDQRRGVPTASAIHCCAIVSDRPELAAAVEDVLRARGVRSHRIGPPEVAVGFDDASEALGRVANRDPELDAVVVALATAGGGEATSDWERVLCEHADLAAAIRLDAGWARAAADLSGRADRPVRVLTLTDATTSGGRSRAQASAQMSRASRGATEDRVAAFAVSIETARQAAIRPVAELGAHLLCSPATVPLAGAELVVGRDLIGLRSHPRAGAAMAFEGTAVPDWFDEALAGTLR